MKKINKILLVDDDDVFNYIAKETIRHAGSTGEIVVTENGKKAYDYLIENNCPDLILLDINMPVMDGFQFLHELEEHVICKESKVAILTTSGREEDREKAGSFSRVIDYIEKPISVEKIQSLFAKVA